MLLGGCGFLGCSMQGKDMCRMASHSFSYFLMCLQLPLFFSSSLQLFSLTFLFLQLPIFSSVLVCIQLPFLPTLESVATLVQDKQIDYVAG